MSRSSARRSRRAILSRRIGARWDGRPGTPFVTSQRQLRKMFGRNVADAAMAEVNAMMETWWNSPKPVLVNSGFYVTHGTEIDRPECSFESHRG